MVGNSYYSDSGGRAENLSIDLSRAFCGREGGVGGGRQ